MRQVTFGSLFAGIGGFDLGLERAGMVCKWQVEIDDYATKVLERHWPNVRRWRDVCTFPPDTGSEGTRDQPREIGGQERKQANQGEPTTVRQAHRQAGPEGVEPSGSDLWNVDLICGGFPCQDISYAGRGAGLEGERSGLFFEALRVVRLLRPRYVLLENVAALLSRGLDRVLGELAQIGYDAEWHCIPAAALGAPHIRDRVFVLGVANCGGRSAREQTSKTVGHRSSAVAAGRDAGALANAPSQGPLSSTHTRSDSKTEGGRTWLQQPQRSGWWATEPDVGRVAHGVPNRVDRLRGLGNAVVPQVAEWIGKQIMESINATYQRDSPEGQS